MSKGVSEGKATTSKISYAWMIPASTHQNNHRTAKETLTSPEIPHDADNHIFPSQAKQVVERLKHIAPGENAWAESIPEHLRLNVKGAKLNNIYK